MAARLDDGGVLDWIGFWVCNWIWRVRPCMKESDLASLVSCFLFSREPKFRPVFFAFCGLLVILTCTSYSPYDARGMQQG